MPPLLANRHDKSMCDRLLVMWTKEEDDILRDQVKLHGIDKWAKIATHLCGKTSRQCRRRWHMFLNVVNKRGGWSADEDELLLEAHRKFGNRWTEIAKKLPGRTDNAVKNRFCVLCKKQTKEAEVSPVHRSVDRVLDNCKEKLQERRFLDRPKVTNEVGGVKKKMRMEANLHNRIPEATSQQRPLEETLQQWKGLQSSDKLTNTPHRNVRLEGSLRPWDSSQSSMLPQQNVRENSLHGWKQLALDSKGGATLERNLHHWEGSQSGALVNDPVCSSIQEEPQSSRVLQSHIPSMCISSHSRLMQENLQLWKRAKSGEATSDLMHQQRALKTSHSMWCSAKAINAANDRPPQQRPVTDLLQWWKGVDKNMMSEPALQQREVDEALHHWEQNSQDSVASSVTQQRSIHKNLPPLSEMKTLATVYMSSSKQSTLVSGMRSWSTMQSVKQSDQMQQSHAGGFQTWDHSRVKGVNDTTSQLRPKENMHRWQDWNANEADDPPSCQHRPLGHNMQIDEQNPKKSADTVSFQQTSVDHLQVWAAANCEQTSDHTLPHKPESYQTTQWNHSKSATNSPHHLLEGRAQQWDKPEAPVNPGPLTSILNRFSGGESTAKTQVLSSHAEREGVYKPQLIEESWKTAVEKLKYTSTTDVETQSPREVLEFDDYMSEGSKQSPLKAAALFPPPSIPPNQAPKVENSTGELQANVKDPQHGDKEGSMPEDSTNCETSNDLCGGTNEKGHMQPNVAHGTTAQRVTNIEGQASGVSQSPDLDIPTDGAHSPTQIVPRSHLTMECMPSPQFSDSEKEFLLSTLDQTATNCWPSSSSSPLRPQSRFSKVRNPLNDICYDTPARSPLSSCLLRQFQVSEASRLA